MSALNAELTERDDQLHELEGALKGAEQVKVSLKVSLKASLKVSEQDFLKAKAHASQLTQSLEAAEAKSKAGALRRILES